MLLRELIDHLEKLDENLEVSLAITSKIDDEEDLPTLSSVESIEFSNSEVILKGHDKLVEWD